MFRVIHFKFSMIQLKTHLFALPFLQKKVPDFFHIIKRNCLIVEKTQYDKLYALIEMVGIIINKQSHWRFILWKNFFMALNQSESLGVCLGSSNSGIPSSA